MKGKIALILVLVAAWVLNYFEKPLGLGGYAIVLNSIAISVMLAVSFNLIMGYTGQFSLGHAGFMAIGAYTSAIITKFVTPDLLGISVTRLSQAKYMDTFAAQGMFVAALLAGGLMAAIAGLIVGVPSLRLKGDYLAIITLGFGEIIRVIFVNIQLGKDGLEGGPLGLSGIPRFTDLFWTISMAAIATYVVTALVKSVYGSGFLVTRDDEIAAEAMGVNTTKYKVIAFVISAFFTGIAGGLFAHLFTSISPTAFGFQKSVEILIFVIFGGMGNVVGVIFAAIFLGTLNEVLREISQWRMVIYALLLIIIMILRPGGLLGTPAEIRRFLARFKKPASTPKAEEEGGPAA